MKTICSLATLALMAFSSATIAQTCTSPTTLASGASGVTGNSCVPPTGTGDGSLGNICDNTQNTGSVAVYTWTNNGGATSGNIVVTPTGWDTAIAIGTGATCAAATGGFCTNSVSDAGGVGAAETYAIPASATQTYFLFITSLALAGNCGPYSITAGTLPVKLQNFSIN
jgi:hypothetical protein